ncbi:Uncharacterized protein FWK35_00024087 [Aphis craccivora]|uniref:Uncharacterized protein n=1 Tax=Aphis craccivora TaxID=307492 RepID=A0A6G0Y4I2_APHCR|nr:Uncharacterized protein FWK35_00024087 [Aphis craccivora]
MGTQVVNLAPPEISLDFHLCLSTLTLLSVKTRFIFRGIDCIQWRHLGGAGGGNCPTLDFLWAGQIFGTIGAQGRWNGGFAHSRAI